MNRLIIILLVFFIFLPAVAQERVVLKMEDSIEVYISFNEGHCFCKLLPIKEYNSDFFYNAIILEKKENRFKLKIAMSDIDAKIESEPIIGWVDKTNCGVFLLCNEYVEQIPMLYLYEYPIIDSVRNIIDIRGIDRSWISIDDTYNGFARISFEIDGIKYSGWINKYCTDMYSLCS